MITRSSEDFTVKDIRKHRLYTLKICITGVAVNLNVSFNCQAITLYFCVGMRTRVHYVYCVMHDNSGRQMISNFSLRQRFHLLLALL